MLHTRAEGLMKIRECIAEILFYMMFHKQDESISQIFKSRGMDDEQDDQAENKKINEAFFD
jgi:hypothetical protein